jgi:hypothetical protein
MTVPPRSAVSGFPIRVFIDIPSSDTLDAVNAVVWDIDRYLAGYAAGTPANIGTAAQLALVLTTEGAAGYATNGCKVGEASGSGTGVEVYFSLGQLRVKSTDAPVRT